MIEITFVLLCVLTAGGLERVMKLVATPRLRISAADNETAESLVLGVLTNDIINFHADRAWSF